MQTYLEIDKVIEEYVSKEVTDRYISGPLVDSLEEAQKLLIFWSGNKNESLEVLKEAEKMKLKLQLILVYVHLGKPTFTENDHTMAKTILKVWG